MLVGFSVTRGELKRCRDHCDGRPFVQHRTTIAFPAVRRVQRGQTAPCWVVYHERCPS